jgi:two-component system, sensor histidine kinase and response regulator
MTELPSNAPLILVADDVAANRELLRDQLQTLGYRTALAHDASSALDAAFELLPDLVVLDVAMPGGKWEVEERYAGVEVCRRLKRDPRTSRIPIIFVTALDDSADRVKAIDAGGDEFVTKPHNRLVLGARVRSLLRLKSATDALEESYRRLRELEKTRDDLMKMIVHDLKIPLTSVLATLELLGDGDLGALSPRQSTAVHDVQRKAEELVGLIDDLLQIRRMEETTVSLGLVPIEPSELLHDVVRAWRLRFEQEQTVVRVHASDGIPSFLGDRQLLRRVFDNLIQNALVHSATPVELELTAAPVSPGVRFTVTDNGPGIPAEHHEAIFGKFVRFAPPVTRRIRTTGLGLTYCRLVVEAHGGRIWVQSAKGEGSTFHVDLPVEPPPRAQNGSGLGHP